MEEKKINSNEIKSIAKDILEKLYIMLLMNFYQNQIKLKNIQKYIIKSKMKKL